MNKNFAIIMDLYCKYFNNNFIKKQPREILDIKKFLSLTKDENKAANK